MGSGRGERWLVRMVPVVGAIRVVAAAGLLWRPRLALSALGAPEVPGARVAARVVAARELVLGAGVLAAGRRGGGVAVWTAAQAAADVVDAAGLLLCARRGWLPRRPAQAAAAFALVGAVTEAATVAALAADHRRGQISAAAGLPASAVPRPTKNSAGTTIAHR